MFRYPSGNDNVRHSLELRAVASTIGYLEGGRVGEVGYR
jgi:hypothetical protein